jgi:hypothetical protein
MKGVSFPTPLFVVGSGRSGTSILCEALASHPTVSPKANIGEAPFIAKFFDFLADYEDSKWHVDSYRSNFKERQELIFNLLFRLSSDSTYTPKRSTGCTHWVSKYIYCTPKNFNTSVHYFDSFAINIVRNGIEVIDSAMNFSGFSHLTFEEHCLRWSDQVMTFNFLDTHENGLTIKHTDLVRNTSDTFEKIYQRLDMEFSEFPINYIRQIIFNSSFSENRIALPTDIEDYFLSRVSKIWMSWDNERRDTFTKICGDAMNHYNFSYE